MKADFRIIRNSSNLFSSTLWFYSSFSRLFYLLNIWSTGLQPAARQHNIMRPAATFVNYIYTTILTQKFRLLGISLIICQGAAREPGAALCHGLTTLITVGRLRLKCDGTRAETRFGLSAKRTSPFKPVGLSSRQLTPEVCASAVVMLDTPCSEVAWGYWLHTPFASFPFTSPPVRHRVPSGFNWTLPAALT
jgi:hypothetical protein